MAGPEQCEFDTAFAGLYRSVTGWCWGCDLYGMVYDAMGTVGGRLFVAFGTAFLKTGAVIVALWCAWTIGKMLSNPASPDSQKAFGKLWGVFLRFVFFGTVFATAAFAQDFFDHYVVRVVLDLPLDVAVGINSTIARELNSVMLSGEMPSVAQSSASEKVRALIQFTHENASFGVTIGVYYLMRAWIGFNIVPGLVGFALAGLHLWILAFFPIRYLDGTIRLFVVLMFMPFILFCGMFDKSRHIFDNAIRSVVYGLLLLTLVSVMFMISNFVLTWAMVAGAGIPWDLQGGAVAKAICAITTDGGYFDISEGKCWRLLVALIGSGFLVVKLQSMARELATEWSQAATGNIGKETVQALTQVVTTAVGALGGAAGAAAGMASRGLGAGLQAVGRSVGGLIRRGNRDDIPD